MPSSSVGIVDRDPAQAILKNLQAPFYIIGINLHVGRVLSINVKRSPVPDLFDCNLQIVFETAIGNYKRICLEKCFKFLNPFSRCFDLVDIINVSLSYVLLEEGKFQAPMEQHFCCGSW